MQPRRILLGTIAALMSFTLLTGFTHNKIPGLGGGGGGGGNWTAIVKDGKEGLGTLASATAVLLKAQAKLGDALGLKQKAASARKEAEKMEKGGETIGGADIEASYEVSASFQKDINAKIMESGKLDAQSAAAVGTAGKEMIPGLVRIAKGISILVKVGSSISGAGQPSATDLAAVEIAAKIPPLLPKAAQSIPLVFSNIESFRKVAAEKNIAVAEIPTLPTMKGI